MVSFCGTVLKHQVEFWGDGDRFCYAHFMREEVRKRLDVPAAGWVDRNIYCPESNIQEMENSEDAMEVDQ